jgi:GT2 family glycosyltransferase
MVNIAVIITTYNRKEYLCKLLNQINTQMLPSQINLIKIVIVDGSVDGTETMLRENFPETVIIRGTGSWWWTRCMNEGFQKALQLNSDYILIINDDTEIKPDYIKVLWNDYQTIPKGSVLGSASASLDTPHLINSAGTQNFKRWRTRSTPYINGIKPVYPEFKGVHPTYSLSGRGTLIPAEVFVKIGFYDEKFVQYGSDDDFILRAQKSGIKCFISWNAVIYNHMNLTSEGTAYRKDNLLKFIKSFFNPYSVNSLQKSGYFYRKHGYPVLLPFYLLYMVLGTMKAYFFKYK